MFLDAVLALKGKNSIDLVCLLYGFTPGEEKPKEPLHIELENTILKMQKSLGLHQFTSTN